MSFRNIAAAVAIAAGSIGSAHAVPVALELSLVIDVSGSISTDEYNLQRQGYKAAFLDAAVQTGITSYSDGIAVNVIQFGTNAQQSIGWTLLKTVADINTFANALGSMDRLAAVGTSTDVQDGMILGISSFASNGYEGGRLVMDVSGDGPQNIDPLCDTSYPFGACAVVQDQRDAAAAGGITVNGLAIEGAYTNPLALTSWYGANVVTASGFVVTANDFNDFERAAIQKIGREINQTPEPGTLALVGLAIAGLGFGVRRRG